MAKIESSILSEPTILPSQHTMIIIYLEFEKEIMYSPFKGLLIKNQYDLDLLVQVDQDHLDRCGKVVVLLDHPL